MYFRFWYVFRYTLIFIFRCVRCNSEYQVHVMELVHYVGWATRSRATLKIRLDDFKKKKKNGSSHKSRTLRDCEGFNSERSKRSGAAQKRDDDFSHLSSSGGAPTRDEKKFDSSSSGWRRNYCSRLVTGHSFSGEDLREEAHSYRKRETKGRWSCKKASTCLQFDCIPI